MMRQPICLLLAAALSLLATAVAAQDGRFASTGSLLHRIESLESDNAQLAAELAALRTGDASHAAVGDDCCCYCASHCYWYAGYDNVIVKPHFSRNVAYFERDQIGASQDVAQTFDWDYEYTPRFWIGYVNDCGTGIQIRYWRFDHATNFSRVEGPGEDLEVEVNLAARENTDLFVDGTLFGEHEIQLDVLDLEVIRQGDYCWGWLRASGGLRYAEMDQRGSWFDADQFVRLEHGFEGIGPTLFVEAGVPLGCGNLSAFVNARGSLLFADRSARFVASGTIGNVDGDELLEYDSQQTILEAQLGADWSTCFGGKSLSLRAALEAQHWFTAGSANANDDEGLPFDQPDLSFFGASLSATLFY